MDIKNDALFIAMIFGVFLILFIIGISVIIYDNIIKNTRLKKDNPQEWLFYDFSSKVYSAIWGNKDPDEVALKLGIKIETYYKDCLLLKSQANVKKIIVNHLYGMSIYILCCVFGLLFNYLFIPMGIIILLLFTKYELDNIHKSAKKRRDMVKDELPHFLELLSAELEIGLPVDKAISILSEKYDCLLSREFLESLNDVKLGGAGGWQAALEKVALKYETDLLSDFVLDITVAFDKGISIANSVRTKTIDIRNKHYLDKKEQAGKAENTILIPIAILQFIPMLAYILLPALEMFAEF